MTIDKKYDLNIVVKLQLQMKALSDSGHIQHKFCNSDGPSWSANGSAHWEFEGCDTTSQSKNILLFSDE